MNNWKLLFAIGTLKPSYKPRSSPALSRSIASIGKTPFVFPQIVHIMAKKRSYYAVANGRKIGIYDNWESCQDQVKGYSDASFKKFASHEQAQDFVDKYKGNRNPAQASLSVNKTDSTESGDEPNVASRKRQRSDSADGDDSATGSESQNLEKRAKKSYQALYVDGACRGNGRSGPITAGFGIYFGPNDSRNEAVAINDHKFAPTNQRAELSALLRGLRKIRAEAGTSGGADEYEIFTDSSYSKNCLEKWSEKWVVNGWKNTSGAAVANRDLIEPLREVYSELRRSGITVKITHVPGHSGVTGNEEADRLANLGADTAVQYRRH